MWLNEDEGKTSSMHEAGKIVEGEGIEWFWYYIRKMSQHRLQKPYSVTLSL